jgi:cystathionine beta-lyase/cystathionine gamma-synthase
MPRSACPEPAWARSRPVPDAWRERWDGALYRLGETDRSAGSPIVPPVTDSALYAFPDTASLRAAFTDERSVPLYTRGANPTVSLLARKLAALEGTEDACCFASGVAAMAAAVLSAVHGHAHVVCVADPYPWTAWLLRDYLPRFGVRADFVDGRDAGAVEAACREDTAALVLESPNSFTFGVQDLGRLGAFARTRGITTIVDNSHASPLRQQPAALGIDLVVHSVTKYLNGHADAVAGVVCGSAERVDALFRAELQGLGGILSPRDAGQVLRGLRTLPQRLDHAARTACRLVAALEAHPRVAAVHFPWHPKHPQATLVRHQQYGPSAQFAFTLDTDRPQTAERFADALERFRLAVSWGGYESLALPAVAKPGWAGHPGLVRCCAGLEDAEGLWADLERAIAAAYA